MMGGETVTSSQFGNLLRKSSTTYVVEPEKNVIGILAFEISTLMSKLVNLWERLREEKITRLRRTIVHSAGIRKFVSDDEKYLMKLILAEIMDDFGCVATSVTRLGKRCVDPLYHHLEYVVEYFVEYDTDWCEWEYRLKKMEKKVKKMRRFSAVTAQLYQEMEVLAEHELNSGKMGKGVGLSKVKLHEVRQKITRQRQEVKKLREMSPWIRTYDYTIRLLLRSLLTILERIKQTFGIDQLQGIEKPQITGYGSVVHNHSICAQPSTLQCKDSHPTLYTRPFGRPISDLGQYDVKKNQDSYEMQMCNQSSFLCVKPSQGNTRRLAHEGSFRGCTTSRTDPPLMQGCMPISNNSLKSSCVYQKDIEKMKDPATGYICQGNILYHSKSSAFISKHNILTAPSSTLGGAALAAHYANVILFIDKLASSPNLIILNAKDELYNMLPARIRMSISGKLKLFTKTLASSIYDDALAAKWNLTLRRILVWLVPLAHNMIRWRSERNFEKQRIVSPSNVLLVETLYFANQEKTEAAITELLMGLNYISRFGKEFTGNLFVP